MGDRQSTTSNQQQNVMKAPLTQRCLFYRALALFLAASLALPNSALALRVQAGLESASKPELEATLTQAGLEEPPFGRWLREDPSDAQAAWELIRRLKQVHYPFAIHKGEREHGTKKVISALLKQGYYFRFYALGSADYFAFLKDSKGPEALIVKAEGTSVEVISALPSDDPVASGGPWVDYPYLEANAGKNSLRRIMERRSVYERIQILERALRSGLTAGGAATVAQARNPSDALDRALRKMRASAEPTAAPSSAAPSVVGPRPLTGRLFNMEGEEARQVLAWAVGRLSLQQGRDYLAFSQTRTMLNIPTTLLAHVLPNTESLREELRAPGLKQAGESVAVTRLLRSPAERNKPVPYTREQMPWLLYRYHEDPNSKEKWISVYRLRLPSGDRPRLADRQSLFRQVSADPEAYVGEILIDFPADLNAEPASNRHLSVFTSLEMAIRGFLRESVSLAEARSVAEYPSRAALPLADGGLDTLWSELERGGVKIQTGTPGRQGLKARLGQLAWEGGWTHLVLRRVVRERPAVAMTHFLIHGTLGRQGETGGWVESSLELIVVLASDHPQWGGEPVALRPLLGAWAVGLIDASQIARSDRVVTVRTNPIDREQLARLAGVPPDSSHREAPGAPSAVPRTRAYDSGLRWVVDTPIKGYVGTSSREESSARQLLGFRTPDRQLLEQKGWHSTHAVAMAERGRHPARHRRPLAFYEADNGDKWVGTWSPGTSTRYYEPQLWIRVSREDVITVGVKDEKWNPKARQHARMVEQAEKYLNKRPVDDVPPIRVRMSIGQGRLPSLRGRLVARLWGRRGRRGVSAQTIAVLPSSEVPAEAIGKRFVLTTPRIPTLPRRPFLRAVGDLDNSDSGLVLHLWLDDTGRYQVRINQLPPELRREPELAADLLTERGLSLEEARPIVTSLQRRASDPLQDYAWGKAALLDVSRLNEMPEADRVVAPRGPLVLIPKLPLAAAPGLQAGVLVSPEEAVAVTPGQFSSYQRIATSPAAGLEEVEELLQYALSSYRRASAEESEELGATYYQEAFYAYLRAMHLIRSLPEEASQAGLRKSLEDQYAALKRWADTIVQQMEQEAKRLAEKGQFEAALRKALQDHGPSLLRMVRGLPTAPSSPEENPMSAYSNFEIASIVAGYLRSDVKEVNDLADSVAGSLPLALVLPDLLDELKGSFDPLLLVQTGLLVAQFDEEGKAWFEQLKDITVEWLDGVISESLSSSPVEQLDPSLRRQAFAGHATPTDNLADILVDLELKPNLNLDEVFYSRGVIYPEYTSTKGVAMLPKYGTETGVMIPIQSIYGSTTPPPMGEYEYTSSDPIPLDKAVFLVQADAADTVRREVAEKLGVGTEDGRVQTLLQRAIFFQRELGIERAFLLLTETARGQAVLRAKLEQINRLNQNAAGMEEAVRFYDGFTERATGAIAPDDWIVGAGLEAGAGALVVPGERRAVAALPAVTELGIDRIFIHPDLPWVDFEGVEEVRLPADPAEVPAFMMEFEPRETDLIVLPLTVAAGLEAAWRPAGSRTPILAVAASVWEEAKANAPVLAALARIARNLAGQVLRVDLAAWSEKVLSWQENLMSISY